MTLWDESGPWPDVWIVDPKGRMAPSLEGELSKRHVAPRKVLSLATLDERAPPPSGVVFADDSDFATLALGVLLGLTFREKLKPIVWYTSSVDEDWIRRYWQELAPGKPIRMTNATAPVLAKRIAYQLAWSWRKSSRRRARP